VCGVTVSLHNVLLCSFATSTARLLVPPSLCRVTACYLTHTGSRNRVYFVRFVVAMTGKSVEVGVFATVSPRRLHLSIFALSEAGGADRCINITVAVKRMQLAERGAGVNGNSSEDKLTLSTFVYLYSGRGVHKGGRVDNPVPRGAPPAQRQPRQGSATGKRCGVRCAMLFLCCEGVEQRFLLGSVPRNCWGR
jgi:hypothetical protein